MTNNYIKNNNMVNHSIFWGKQPSVLFNKNEIFELWPTRNMDIERKLNAISRLVILLTLVSVFFTLSMKVFLVGIVTLIIIYIYYYQFASKEGFTIANQSPINNQTQTAILGNTGSSSTSLVNPETLEVTLTDNYITTNSKNPFSNVLLPEIKYDRNRKPAPPAFNVQVSTDITKSTKQMVQELNPDIINTNKQLFGDLAENFMLDQSNRVFYSTANTRVTDDQGAYSKFLYGDMPSCKNNDTLQCVKDNFRYTLY